MRDWKVYGPTTTFHFGMHKGKTLEEVANCHASYILWCVRNLNKFLIHVDYVYEYQDKYKLDIEGIVQGTDRPYKFSLNYYIVSDQDVFQLLERWQRYEFELKEEDDLYLTVHDNPYYNDNLDMDQQDPDFWDSF